MDWTKLCEALITIASLLVSGFLIPWLKSKISEKNLEKALLYTEIAVGAAEQIANNEGWTGKKKKEWVENWLSEHGINLDTEKISAMIENAVLLLHNDLKTTEE